MRRLIRFRLSPWGSLLLLALTIPNAATSQPLSGAGPELSARMRENLVRAAADSLLPHWQRDFMMRVAEGSQGLTQDSSAADSSQESPTDPADTTPGTWAELLIPSSSVTSVASRYGHSAIYDPVRGRLLVFGGIGSTYYNETWSLSLGSTPAWTALKPTGPLPSPRVFHSAIYDPVRDRMVVFGGFDGTRYLGEAWSLSLAGTPGWTQLTPTGTPPSPRDLQSAIYDPLRDRMVVFGGNDGSYHGDTWSLSLGGTPNWAELTTTGAAEVARHSHSAIYDPVRDRMVVFGGWRGSSRNDAWTLPLSGSPDWGAMTISGTPPSARYGHTSIYDPVRDRMVMFGGSDGPLLRSDIWVLSLGATPVWTMLIPSGTSPPARSRHAAIYDPAMDRMVIAGGYSSASVFDVWSQALSGAPAWNDITPGPDTSLGPPPAARSWHSAIYDPVRDRMLVFGGYSGYNLNDLWALSLGNAPKWTALSPIGTPPSPRYQHSAIYDPVRDRMLLFGGVDFAYRNDLWSLTLAGTPVWSVLTPSGTPPSGRSGHSAIYDPVRDRMLVFGGFGGSYLNDVWALSLGGSPQWTALTATGLPPLARAGHSAIYDPVRDRMVMFGGVSGVGRFNDTRTLSLGETPVWAQLAQAGVAPIARAFLTANYDPRRDRMVIFGGGGGSGYLNEVRALLLSGTPTWLVLHPAGSAPSARQGHSAIYDPVFDRIFMFGGASGSTLNDVWTLTFGDVATPSLVSLVAADGFADRVELTWQLGPDGANRATIYRRDETSDWRALASVSHDGLDRIVWTDREVTPGARYGYRLGYLENGVELFAGETWVEVPAPLVFALHGARPNPSTGRLSAALTLATNRPATLELFDLAGRRLGSREVGSLGPGAHVVEMTPGRRLATGVYLLRLTQGGRTLTSRAAIVR